MCDIALRFDPICIPSLLQTFSLFARLTLWLPIYPLPPSNAVHELFGACPNISSCGALIFNLLVTILFCSSVALGRLSSTSFLHAWFVEHHSDLSNQDWFEPSARPSDWKQWAGEVASSIPILSNPLPETTNAVLLSVSTRFVICPSLLSINGN